MTEVVQGQLDSLAESDWNGLVASSREHGVAPLLYHRLTSGPATPRIPENVLRMLREDYLINGARNALLYQDLQKLLQALRQDQIPVIALKGACLAELVYGDPALRTMGDIDIMVGKADLPRTANRLRAMGYSCKNYDLELRAMGYPGKNYDLEKWCLLFNHLPRFFKPPNPRVEIHWTILMPTRPLRPDLEGLWNRARPATIAGTGALVLSPADLLLHLCAHAGGQDMGPFCLGLRPLCDISAVLQHYEGELDWKEVAARAREWQAARCVFLALLLAKTMLAARVPEEFLQSLRPGDFDDRWLATAQSIVLAGEAGEVMRPVKVFADKCATASLGDRVKRLLRTAFPAREYMAGYMDEHYSLPLTPMRSYTCYGTRGLDLMGKSVRLAWQWSTRPRLRRYARQLRQSASLQKWLDNNNP
jgi:hypothetical protein